MGESVLSLAGMQLGVTASVNNDIMNTVVIAPCLPVSRSEVIQLDHTHIDCAEPDSSQCSLNS